MTRAIFDRRELYPLFTHSSQGRASFLGGAGELPLPLATLERVAAIGGTEREDLETATVGHHRSRPVAQGVEATSLTNGLFPWSQVEVVGVGQEDLSSDGVEHLGSQAFDGCLGADGDKAGRMDGAVGSGVVCSASSAGKSGGDVKTKRRNHRFKYIKDDGRLSVLAKRGFFASISLQ